MDTRAHIDTVIMIITGKVVPYDTNDDPKVTRIGYTGPAGGLYDTLSIMMGQPVFTHHLPAVIAIAASYFIKVYPELDRRITFPLIYDPYCSWRADFLAEHDLPEWFDLPYVDKTKLDSQEILIGSKLTFIEPDGSQVEVVVKPMD